MSLFGRGEREAQLDARMSSIEATVSSLIEVAAKQQDTLEKLLESHSSLMNTVSGLVESQSDISEEIARALLAAAKGMAGLHDDAVAALEAAIAAQDDVHQLRESHLMVVTALQAREKSAEASMALPAAKSSKTEGVN